MSARERLAELTARWRRRQWLATLAGGLGAALPLAALAWLLPLPATARGALVPCLLALALGIPLRRLRPRLAGEGAVAAHLDRRLPALEESTSLLLVTDPLPPLQELQRARVARRLLALEPRALAALLPWRTAGRGALALLLGAAAAGGLLALSASRADVGAVEHHARGASAGREPAADLLRSLLVSVQPPAYTGRAPRTERSLGFATEEGALLGWRVRAASPVSEAWLVVDEDRRLPLARGVDGDFVAAQVAREPALLRLVLASPAGELWRSAPARLEVVPDRAPSVELVSPTALVERPAAAPGALELELLVADDYGVKDGVLLATLATGSDEQVEFRDQRLALPLRRSAAPQRARRRLELAALGMVAGAELYLRAEVRDERGNLARSPTLVVRIPGERRESVDLEGGIPMLLGPELLRSQRQIVVDTERLLAESPRLSRAELARRSTALALDQRAVRFRYGVLLGDEFVGGRAVEADEAHPGGEEGAAGSLAGIPEALEHQHDSSESATYFPAPVRQRLKAMLAAMWEAEGQLAVIAPRTALPAERRALALLKEVQQASRVYVRRGGAEGAPLDPARRLSGELGEVRDRAARPATRPPSPLVDAAHGALDALAGEATAGDALPAIPPGALRVLRPALARRARGGDAAALAALPALDALAAGARPEGAGREALQRALWSLLPAPETPPRRPAAGGALADRYRRALEGGG